MFVRLPKMRRDVLLQTKILWYKRLVIAGAFLIGSSILCILYFHDPGTVSWYPSCIFHDYTGLHCFGCGNTRAAYHLLHGNIRESLSCNIMLVPYILLFLCIILKPKCLEHTIAVWGIPGAVITFTILRNLPWKPFCLLAPY